MKQFTDAIASALKALYPQRRAFINRVPQSADGHHYIRIIEAEQASRLNRRRHGTLQFEILIMLSTGDSLDYYDWSASLFEHFEQLTVELEPGQPRLFHTINRHARPGQDHRTFQFLFDIDADYLLAPDPGDPMETLQLKEEIKP